MQTNLELYKHATHFLRDTRFEFATPKTQAWLERHIEAWAEFVRVCQSAEAKGMDHWSARAAMDVVRYKLFDKRRKQFSFSNSMTPFMGRLYNHIYCSHRPDFLRTRPLTKTASPFNALTERLNSLDKKAA
jgi:hypothetical protein